MTAVMPLLPSARRTQASGACGSGPAPGPGPARRRTARSAPGRPGSAPAGPLPTVCMPRPPADRAPNSRPASTVPSGVARPSSATVIASKPTEPTTASVTPCSSPRRVIVDREPGEQAGDRHGRDVDLRDAHARGPGRVGVGADGAHLEPEPAAFEHPPHDERRHQGQRDAEVEPEQGRVGRVLVGQRAQQVVAARALERLLGQEVEHREPRDLVEHDRGDHLVGAGLCLEDTRRCLPTLPPRASRRRQRRPGGRPAGRS